MLFKNTAGGCDLYFHNVTTGLAVTGDASNISVTISKDGGATASSTNSVSETGGGVYSLALTAAETNADRLAIIPSSSTSNVVGSPVIAYTTGGAVPAAAAGAASGLALTSSVSAVSTKVDDVQGSGFDTATDSLEAVRNRGDAAWITATGFSTHSAADVWSVGTRTLSAFGFSVDVGTIESGDATTALETAATNSLTSYDPPTKAEIDTAFDAVQGSGFDTATDSLEALRNRGDAAWITATGFNTTTPPTASAVADAVWDEVQSAHTTSGTFGYYLDAQVSSAAAPPTAAAIADAVWDELTSAHTVSGSYGKAIGDGITDWVTATGFSTFNPSSDTVANVTTVGSVSGTVSADVVSVSGDSTAAANLEADYDGTGYAKTNSTIGTTTTNTDMRGTDSAFLAASAPTNFGDLAITASTGRVTVGTNNDKTGYSISGTLQTLDALNNFDPAADTVANVTTAGTVTNGVTVSTVSDGAIGADAVADIWSTTAIGESYASDGSAGTGAQLLYQIQQALTEFAISSTTVTVKKLDGSTTASTYTLDDASSPTSRTRAS